MPGNNRKIFENIINSKHQLFMGSIGIISKQNQPVETDWNKVSSFFKASKCELSMKLNSDFHYKMYKT